MKLRDLVGFPVFVLLCCLCVCCEKATVPGELRARPSDIRRYVFEEHRYIGFGINNMWNGMAHDPACPCHYAELLSRRTAELGAAKEGGNVERIREAEYLLRRAYEASGSEAPAEAPK